MKTFQINGKSRANLGKKDTKELRRNEMIPCALYGLKAENVNFAVSESDVRNLIYTPNAYIVEVTIDGKTHNCVMKDIQFHPVTDKILHIDFTNIDENKPVTIEIPIKAFGNSEGVKQGGKLQVMRRKLKVSALRKDLPDTLPVDISALELGKSISVGELSFENLNILNVKSDIVLSIRTTRAAAMQASAAAEEAKKSK